MPSSTVENYLKTILLQSGQESGVVTVGRLAVALEVTPGTVTTMVKGLSSQGLLEHHPREGVILTDSGRTVALGVLRKHRLVETFLVQILKMDWADVHQEAEALEHAISDKVLERIDALLNFPSEDPHGDPIPGPAGQLAGAGSSCTLANCPTDSPLTVTRIADQSPSFLEFVQSNGLKPGAKVTVIGREPASGVVRCMLPGGGRPVIGIPAGGRIEVRVD